MAAANPFFFLIIIFTISVSFPTSISQSPADSCNGIYLSYTYDAGYPISPRLLPSDPLHQPYRFQSTVNILNNGLHELKSWRVFVGFQYNEFLVSASNAVLADGGSLPANVSINGTIFAGFPVTDLKTAIETAGELNQMSAKIQLVGTQFGVGAPDVPLPTTIALANDGYLCPSPTKQGNNVTHTCCIKDSTVTSNLTLDEGFLPRQAGDLTIMYDIMRTYDTDYWAQVTISNHNPVGRLDNWQLNWDWMRDEFISEMKGAYPHVIDPTGCIFGRQGEFYKDKDFSAVLNCEKRPTIIDLPPSKANDPNLGLVPFCCRNGTILPPEMDPSKSVSVFQMNVFKMPPNLNRTDLVPPQNWEINSTQNPDYQCRSPVRVNPTQFPDPSGLPSDSTAVASWQVICNMTKAESKEITSPKCCVSFSAFFNDTVVPCNTCACGCNNSSPSNTCSATEPALLLPSEALLVPFDNRTDILKDKAKLRKQVLPNPLPCGDNCGVSINWHIVSDYKSGWSARITLFNWGETNIIDWFTAVEFDKAGPGFEAVYSFNGSALAGDNRTIFMQGLSGSNYLQAETDGKNPRKDPRLPGTQQTVISFKKKMTPGINVAGRDGFPTRVVFNGEECSLPTIFPNNGFRMGAVSSVLSFLVAIVALAFMQQ